MSSNSVKRTKSVQFQTIQFSISTLCSFVRPIDRALLGATTPGQSGPGSDGNEGVIRIPPQLQPYWNLIIRCLVLYSGHLLGVLNPLLRCGRCIQLPQPTGPQETRWWGVLFLWRDAVGVFNNPCLLGNQKSKKAVVIGILETIPKGMKRSWKRWKSNDHRIEINAGDSATEIQQNAEMCPGDLSRLAVTETPSKDHQLITV